MTRKTLLLVLSACLAAACAKETGIREIRPEEKPDLLPAMPVIHITTEGKKPVTDRETYIPATFIFADDSDSREPVQGEIRARGNSSWWNAQKKSYRIRLENKEPVLGRTANRHWVLIANYFDKTMLRNELAFYLSRTSPGLKYTPESDFVEVIFNGEYLGVYQLVDHVRTGYGRVRDQYLLEIDVRAEETEATFTTPHCSVPIIVSEPDCTQGDEMWQEASDFVLEAENRLFSGDLSLLDLDSFVDWYLINEIAKNNNSIFFTSCFMSFTPGGKLSMGPVWDFDIAFGNTTYNDNDKEEGFWLMKAAWFDRLMKEKAFVDRVKARFAEFYAAQPQWYDYLDHYAAYLTPYIQLNEERWKTMNVTLWSNPYVFPTYEDYMKELHRWLKTRMDWMKTEIDKIPS